MFPIFESLVPVFLLIALGAGLRRLRVMDDAGWGGLERLSYFVLFPALLFTALYKADTAALSAGTMALAFLLGSLFSLAGMALLRRPVQAAFGLSPASYTSIYQAVTRWNGFVALAIAEKLYDAQAMAIVALAMAALIIPINIANITMLARHGEREGARPDLWRMLATHPHILAVLAGIAVNRAGIAVPEPLAISFDLVSRTSLPLGLILVGAGLKLVMPGRMAAAAGFAVALRLFAMPAVFFAAGLVFGISGRDLAVMALCGAVPTAMTGYVLARQMGGDAPFFAAISTLQTIGAFLTIPLVIFVATALSGG